MKSVINGCYWLALNCVLHVGHVAVRVRSVWSFTFLVSIHAALRLLCCCLLLPTEGHCCCVSHVGHCD